MDYVFKDPEKQFMTRVKLRNDFMLDQFVADRRLNSDGKTHLLVYFQLTYFTLF